MVSSDLERRIAKLEAAVERHAEQIADIDSDTVSRRTLLQGLGVLGLGSVAAGTASADPQGHLGRTSDPLKIVYTEALGGGVTGDTKLSSLVGAGLAIEDEKLQAVVTGATNTGDGTYYGLFNGNDGGTLQFRSLSAGNNVTINEQPDELVIESTDTSGGKWNDGDNDSLLEPDSGFDGIDLSGVSNPQVVTSWLGTTDATDLEFYTNDTLAGTIETEGTDLNSNTSAGNVLLGQYSQAKNGAVGASVLGGGSPVSSNENIVYDDYGVIGGGSGNQAGTDNNDSTDAIFATVAGGFNNKANGQDATIGGGGDNTASAYRASIAGGGDNTASAQGAAVGGGEYNDAQAQYATIAGGGPSDTNNASSTNNVAYDNYCTIGGGGNNEAGSSDTSHSAHYATVCGGEGNAAYDDHSAVVGGKNNTAGVDNSTDSGETGGFVGAGYGNTASGFEAMIPGGKSNTADGDRSFAAGRQASADHNGAFVWGDSSSTSVSSSATDEVRFQATGGLVVENTSTVKVTAGLAGGTANDVHIDSSTGQLYDASASSARYKTNIEPLAADTESVLELEPRSFEYKETEQESVGFVAEEADETFPEIVVYDEEGRPDGIQYSRLGVYLLPEVRRNRTDTEQLQARVRDQRDRIDELEAELDRKAERVDKLEAELESRGERVDELERDLDAKDERIARLEERLDAVEAALD